MMNKKLFLVILMSLGVLLVACSASDAAPDIRTADEVKRITPADAKALLDDGTAVLYDTRTPDQFRGQHAAGAISFPAGAETARLGELPTDKALIFYCT
jgi:hypothetical protein